MGRFFMSKQTITHVRKNKKGVITHILVGEEYTKAQIIKKMKGGSDFIVKDGTDVRVVDEKYIRSDRNGTPEDNLGNLPAF
jgi:predicted RecB family nuclease